MLEFIELKWFIIMSSEDKIREEIREELNNEVFPDYFKEVFEVAFEKYSKTDKELQLILNKVNEVLDITEKYASTNKEKK